MHPNFGKEKQCFVFARRNITFSKSDFNSRRCLPSAMSKYKELLHRATGVALIFNECRGLLRGGKVRRVWRKVRRMSSAQAAGRNGEAPLRSTQPEGVYPGVSSAAGVNPPLGGNSPPDPKPHKSLYIVVLHFSTFQLKDCAAQLPPDPVCRSKIWKVKRAVLIENS